MKPSSSMTILLGIAVLITASLAFAASPRRGQPAPPRIEPSGGEYPLNVKVNVVIRSEPGTTLAYTLDGSFPGHYNGIRIESNYTELDLPPRDTILRAVAIRRDQQISGTREARFIRR